MYTPKPHRGHGYAGAAVAAISQHFVDQGARVCLFTDQANPVSNKVYERIGYEPVVEMAEYVVEGSPCLADTPYGSQDAARLHA